MSTNGKSAANSAPNQRGRPFPKGQSGNPAGKPKGARHRLTVLAEKLMADDAEAVTRAVIAAAKSGDMQAARLILDRIAPTRKGRPVALELPSVETAADVLKALGVLVAETASGTITPEEAVMIASVFETKRKAIETVDIERRLAALEGEAKRQ
jgi:ethanolamine utilization microcompartment shell protein EutS